MSRSFTWVDRGLESPFSVFTKLPCYDISFENFTNRTKTFISNFYYHMNNRNWRLFQKYCIRVELIQVAKCSLNIGKIEVILHTLKETILQINGDYTCYLGTSF